MKSKFLILLSWILCLGGIKGQDKTTSGNYTKTTYLAGEDGSYVKVEFRGADGKTISFIESDETFMADQTKKDAFTGKGKEFGDITNQKNTGYLYSITYFINDAGNNIIKSAVISGARISRVEKSVPSNSDSIKKVVEGYQSKMATKFKCPDCPKEGAKGFLKEYINTLTKQMEAETKPKEKEKIAKTIEFLKNSLTENKFLTYYFTDKRASVLISKKFNGRYFAVQTKKVNKWAGLGIDDDWANCHEVKGEDKISNEEAIKCADYFDFALKDQGSK